MECTDLPEGREVGSRLLSTLRLAWEGEGARRDTAFNVDTRRSAI